MFAGKWARSWEFAYEPAHPAAGASGARSEDLWDGVPAGAGDGSVR